ncbi:MAG: hypothetical protein GX465_14905, partial [Acidobacteria bacterium]|nr:hypothetical protein [Acidobacteriota bacterium]
ALVEEYLRKDSGDHLVDLRSFVDPSGDEGTLYLAATARNRDGKKHPHQRRIPLATLEAGASTLLSHLVDLQSSKSFDQLHSLVRSITDGIKGLGPLYIYDTALRFGFAKKLVPEMVYLHCGTMKGARKLGLRSTTMTLSKEHLPSGLNRLSSMDTEDFLCRFKNRLHSTNS